MLCLYVFNLNRSHKKFQIAQEFSDCLDLTGMKGVVLYT